MLKHYAGKPMSSRTRDRAFLLEFFMDEGLEPNLLAEAAQLAIAERYIDFDEKTSKSATERINKNKDCKPDLNSECSIQYQDDQFKEQFRLERSTFESLLQVIGKAVEGLEQQQPIARISLTEKLLYTLTILSRKISFREAGETFAIPTSSGHQIFKWIIAAFAALMPRYITWPSPLQSLKSYPVIGSLSGVVGVVAEYRICLKLPIRPLPNSKHQCQTLALQAVCDASSKFLDVHIDEPNDLECVLLKSALFDNLVNMEKIFMPQHLHLVGDMSYPLMPNLMTPFADSKDLSPCHILFNRACQLWNKPIEQAFNCLLSRFRRLESLDVSTLDLGRLVLSAACMLHNFALHCGECIEDYSVNLINMPPNSIKTIFEGHGLMEWQYIVAAEKKRQELVASFIDQI